MSRSVVPEQRRYEEAEEFGIQVLKRREKTLGRKHPDTLLAVYDLAITTWDLEKAAEAIELMRRCAGLCLTELGSDHEETRRSMTWLKDWEEESVVKPIDDTKVETTEQGGVP